jgi:hypothetical protein
MASPSRRGSGSGSHVGWRWSESSGSGQGATRARRDPATVGTTVRSPMAGRKPPHEARGPTALPVVVHHGTDCLWLRGTDGRGGRLLRLLHRRGSGLGRVDRLAAGSRRLHAVVVQAWDSSPGTTGFTRCNRPPPWPSGWWPCCRPPTSSQGMVRPSGEPSTLAAAREADRGAGVSRRPAVGGQRHRGAPVPGRA